MKICFNENKFFVYSIAFIVLLYIDNRPVTSVVKPTSKVNVNIEVFLLSLKLMNILFYFV